MFTVWSETLKQLNFHQKQEIKSRPICGLYLPLKLT